MMVIIVGVNRVEYCNVKKKDLGRHFFVTRGQLYKVYPDLLTKMELTDKKGLIRTETVIMYPENSIRPYLYKSEEYDGRLDPYDMNTIFAQVDEHRYVTDKSKYSRIKPYFTSVKSIWNEISSSLPLIVAGIVCVLAFTGVI